MQAIDALAHQVVNAGSATIVANIGSYATLGNNQWSAEVCVEGVVCVRAHMLGKKVVLRCLLGRAGASFDMHCTPACFRSNQCATGKSCSLEALYIRKGETLFISVWGTEGRNQGDDDHDLAIDRYYISVASVQ